METTNNETLAPDERRAEYQAEFKKAFRVADDLRAWRGGNHDTHKVTTFLNGVHRILEVANGRSVSTLEVIQGLKYTELDIETILGLWSQYCEVQCRFGRMIHHKPLIYDWDTFQMVVPVG